MVTTPSTGKILLIHSQKDQILCSWINSYLNEFKLKGIIHQHPAFLIEDIMESSKIREQLHQSRDLLLLVATPNFLKSDFAHSTFFQQLVTRHQLGRNLVLPLFFYESKIDNHRLSRMARLKTNTNTLSFNSISELHQQLIPVFQELASITTNWCKYNDILNESWQEAKALNSYDAYLQFQKRHKHSVFDQQAESYIKALKEEKLWQEALSFDNMEYYFRYLSEAPQKKYEDACIKKIMEFESKQEVAQTDALKNKNIALALDFKSRYGNRAFTPEVDNHLFRLFEEGTLHTPNIATQKFYLKHQALKNCTPEEALSLNLSLNYDQHLKSRLTNLIGKFKSFHVVYIAGIIVSLLAFCWLFFFNSFSIFHTGKIDLLLFIAYIAFAYIGHRCFTGLVLVNQAIKKHENSLDQIKKDHIYLQVAAINKDKKTTDQILFNFANTNFNLIPYEKTNLFAFIALEEDLQLEKQIQTTMMQKA